MEDYDMYTDQLLEVSGAVASELSKRFNWDIVTIVDCEKYLYESMRDKVTLKDAVDRFLTMEDQHVKEQISEEQFIHELQLA